MYHNKTILAIIPARGGSKGIPHKNIIDLGGKPLIAWTIEEAKKSKYIDRLILSSDDEKIIQVAKKYGCEAPFIRPTKYAKDSSPTIEAIIHAIKSIKENYDYVLILQPTSPFRKAKHIDEAIALCINSNANSCISVTKAQKSLFWAFKLTKRNTLQALFKNYLQKRRQDLPETYLPNGAIYITKSNWLLKNKKIFSANPRAYLMNRLSSIDIDDMIDLYIARSLAKTIKHKKLLQNFY